jgi:hypothetical protein
MREGGEAEGIILYPLFCLNYLLPKILFGRQMREHMSLLGRPHYALGVFLIKTCLWPIWGFSWLPIPFLLKSLWDLILFGSFFLLILIWHGEGKKYLLVVVSHCWLFVGITMCFNNDLMFECGDALVFFVKEPYTVIIHGVSNLDMS